MRYKQLTHEERHRIAVLWKAGFNQTEIAMLLQRHKSATSQEITGNIRLRGCRPKQV